MTIGTIPVPAKVAGSVTTMGSKLIGMTTCAGNREASITKGRGYTKTSRHIRIKGGRRRGGIVTNGTTDAAGVDIDCGGMEIGHRFSRKGMAGRAVNATGIVIVDL